MRIYLYFYDDFYCKLTGKFLLVKFTINLRRISNSAFGGTKTNNYSNNNN